MTSRTRSFRYLTKRHIKRLPIDEELSIG